MTTAPRPVADLLAERAKYALWIEQLAARTAGAPAHVVAKVRADYEARLAAVREALGARAAELEAQRRQAIAARDAAIGSEQALADARAEAELRHAVGEYSAEEWATLARESDAALAAAAADRMAAQTVLDDVERAWRDVQAEPAVASAPVAAAPVPAATVPAAPELAAPVPAAPVPAAPEAPPLRPSVAIPLALEGLLLPVEDLEPIPTPSAGLPLQGAPLPPAAPAAPRSQPQDAERDDLVPPTVTTSVERPAMPAAPIDDLFLAPIDDLPAPPPPPPPAPSHAAPVAPTGPRAGAPADRAPARPSGGIRGTEAFDDLEFLKSLGRVSSAGASAAPPEAAPPGVPGPSAPPSAPPPHRTTAATTRPMTPPRTMTPARAATPPRPPVIPAPPPPPRISQQFAPPPEPIPPDPSVASPESKLFEARLTDPGVDSVRASSYSAGSLRASGASSAAKSLKCAECGAMNYPTEWYCERCGGELASL